MDFSGFTALVRLLGFMHGPEVRLVADAQLALLFWLLLGQVKGSK